MSSTQNDTPTKSPTKRLNLSLSQELVNYLEQLAVQGVMGSNPSEVARYLVQQGVTTAIRDGFLRVRVPKIEARSEGES